jgi:hypothetical protein
MVIGEQGYPLMAVPKFVQILSYPKHPKPRHRSSIPQNPNNSFNR